MNTVALTPASRAAHATAWPWLPALAATTPARRSSSDSVAILLTAPRILNEPVRWQVLGLQRDLAADALRERLRAVDRRHARDALEPRSRLLDLAKAGCRLRLQA